MRRPRISPFDLYDALAWIAKQQATSDHPEDSVESEITLARESVGGRSRYPPLITTDGLIQGWISPESEEQMDEREGYGGTRSDATVYPQYGCLRIKKMGVI